MIHCLLHSRLNQRFVSDITMDRQTRRTQPLQFSGALLATFVINIRENDTCTILCHPQSGCGSDASASSSDKCYTSLKFSHGSVFSLVHACYVYTGILRSPFPSIHARIVGH